MGSGRCPCRPGHGLRSKQAGQRPGNTGTRAAELLADRTAVSAGLFPPHACKQRPGELQLAPPLACSSDRTARYESGARPVELARHGPPVSHDPHPRRSLPSCWPRGQCCTCRRPRPRTRFHRGAPSPRRCIRSMSSSVSPARPVLSRSCSAGEALTPDRLSQMAALVNDIVSDPGVGDAASA